MIAGLGISSSYSPNSRKGVAVEIREKKGRVLCKSFPKPQGGENESVRQIVVGVCMS
jgi:hypothetical protein